MTPEKMKISIHEIKDQDLEIEFDKNTEWLNQTITGCDEQSERDALRPAGLKSTASRDRPANLRVNLRRVDEIFVVSGEIQTQVHLLCSRCANPLMLPIDRHFSVLYTQDKQMGGVPYVEGHELKNKKRGSARHAASPVGEGLSSESTDDVEMTYLPEDEIALDALVLEQIHLVIPYQPLCREDCKGICANCGTDLNIGRCACNKLAQSPFAALQKMKDSRNRSDR